jgi:hypothetical protein
MRFLRSRSSRASRNVAATVTLVDSAKSGFLYIVPADMLLITEMFGINEEVKRLVERGGHVKGISDISYADIAPSRGSTLAKNYGTTRLTGGIFRSGG